MSLLLILAGLALAVISAAIYAGNIRGRFWLQMSCAGFGGVVAGICGLSDLMVGLPAAIAGLMAWGASAWASCRTFPVGQASVYQPAFFRDPNSPLNPDEWLIMMPGFQMFWDFFCEPVATLEIGRLAFERKVDVRSREGVSDVWFRIDAQLPLNRPDLLGRFVQSVESGTDLTNAPARSAYITERLTALTKQALEACAELVSAYDADALELQAVAEGNNPSGFNYLQNLAYVAQELLGLPAKGWDEDGNLVDLIKIEIIDFVPGEELQKIIANRAINDSITEKSIDQLNARGMPPPDVYRLTLRERQQRNAARYDAMPDDEFNDTSKEPVVIELEAKSKSMLTLKEFDDLLAKDTKSTGKTQSAIDYREKHALAQAAPQKAAVEELRYRHEAIAAENRNIALGDAALAADPKRVMLASRLEKEMDEYRTLYGKAIQSALDKVAAGIDTSRISIDGLEGIGGASGLEALRMLRPAGGKGGAS